MVWNQSEQLTPFPFRSSREGEERMMIYDNDRTYTPSSPIVPDFPGFHNLTRTTTTFPLGIIANENGIDPFNIKYSSPETVFAVLVIFSIFTIFGNFLVMFSVVKEHYLQSPPNYFVASLAAADFSVGVILLPFEAITQLLNREWIFGDIFCDLWHSFDVMLTTASILNLSVISLDRYWAICTPLQYPRRMTPKRAFKFIALVWICAIMISLPAIFWWRLVRTEPITPGTCPFTDDVSYLVSSSCISFYIPLSVMLFAYYKIYLAAVKQSKSIQQGAKLFSSHDKNGTGDITLRIHRGGGNGGNNGNNNTICGPPSTALSHRQSFHFGRSDPTGLTLLTNGCKRSNTVKVRRVGYSTYFTRRSSKDQRMNSNSDSTALQIRENGEVIAPILLLSDDERTTDQVSNITTSPENNVDSSGAISSASSSPIMGSPANATIAEDNSEKTNSIPNHNNHSHNHLIPITMSFRRHSRRSFTVARKIAKFAKEKKAAKTLAIVLGVFIICWLPFFLINIVFALCKSCADGHVILFEVATWLGWMNSCLNPIIYSLWSPDFRRAFARLLGCSRCVRARQRRKTQRRLSVV